MAKNFEITRDEAGLEAVKVTREEVVESGERRESSVLSYKLAPDGDENEPIAVFRYEIAAKVYIGEGELDGWTAKEIHFYLSCDDWPEHFNIQIPADRFTSDEQFNALLAAMIGKLSYTLPQRLLEAVLPAADEARVVVSEALNIPTTSKKDMAEAHRALVGQRQKKDLLLPRQGGSDPDVEATNEQCKSLARRYPAILKFWQDTRKLQRKKDNWRAHVKLDHPDTPNDLLDRLDNLDPYISKPSAIALEHAARMCGIETNGCSESTLKRLRTRGRTRLRATQS